MYYVVDPSLIISTVLLGSIDLICICDDCKFNCVSLTFVHTYCIYVVDEVVSNGTKTWTLTSNMHS